MQWIEDYRGHLSLLMEQYKDSPNLQAVISGILEQGNAIEEAMQELYTLLSIQQAEGVQLDVIGRLVGVARGAQDDEAYRLVLISWLQLQYSGTYEAIIKGVKELSGATSVRLVPDYPAGLLVFAPGAKRELTQQQLEALAPAGVMISHGCVLVDTTATPILQTTSGANILIAKYCQPQPIESEYGGYTLVAETGEVLTMEI